MSQDLNGIYIKHMRDHGCGVAMFQPIAFADMKPPCCGYFDRNGNWNLIARLSKDIHHTALSCGLGPLKRKPQVMHEIGLRWQPKCSKGVRMFNVDVSGKTPDVGVPVGADAHVKYKSKIRFGAVLIAKNPVSVTALNDEGLFKDWVESNKPFLYSQFGRELKKYGMWVVTVTYTAPGCSINAWLDKDKEALLSAKAKASMVGDYGAKLAWTDHITDKDWCHYSGDPTRWDEEIAQQATSQPGSTAPTPSIPKESEERDPSCPVTRSDDSTMMAATASPNDEQPKTAQDLDGQPARHPSREADGSPVDNDSNLISDTHEASAEPTTLNLNPVPQRKSPSIDQHNGRHRSRSQSRSHTRVPGMKAPPSSPAKNEGVVLFFDGIRVDQVEWWIEGLKDLTSSIFASAPARSGKNIASRHERPLSKHMSGQAPISQLPILATKGNREECSPLNVSFGERDYGDTNEDYDPEKDEGVYPSDWPRKSNSLLSGRPGHLEQPEGNTVDPDEINPYVNATPRRRRVIS